LSSSGAPRTDDSYLYAEDAIAVGLILFPPRTCSACAAVLPANTDYFAPSQGTLKSACRRCVRDRYRETDRVKAKERRVARKSS